MVGAESKVGTGGGAASFVACGEEVCSQEEELGLAVDPGVPEGSIRSLVGLSPFFSVNLLRVDPKKDFAFEVLITACAKYDVLVRGSELGSVQAAFPTCVNLSSAHLRRRGLSQSPEIWQDVPRHP